MKGTMRILDVDKIEATLTLTMPLKQWKELNAQLSSAHSSWKLSNLIDALIQKATSMFTEEINE